MSEILVDNLTGKTSAGDITVTSEGGAATQSLQQGLAKAWVNFNATTTSARDSFNVSSITDNGTGIETTGFTNSMSNANYSLPAQGSFDITGSTPTNYTGLTVKQGTGYSTTSSCKVAMAYITNTGGYISDFEIVCLGILGDLA
jgi:hypothetical protein